MTFESLILTENGNVTARATGHSSDVVTNFHRVCTLLLGDMGPWRITKVHGECSDEEGLDSDMVWSLEAKLKMRTQERIVL